MKEAISFPENDAPISNATIKRFILDAQDEIEKIYHTKFGCIDDSGTAGTATTTSIGDDDKLWPVNQLEDSIIWVYGGTGSGQYREIQSNTGTAIVVSPAWETTPSTDSTYRIVKLGYKDETIDGSGETFQFVKQQPLIKLNALTVNGSAVTPSKVSTYLPSGKLELKNNLSPETTVFSDTYPQLINMKYIYGVYPIPRIIKRLACIVAGIKTLVSQVSGTYDDFTTVSLPGGLNASKGEPYVNIKSALASLQREAKGIVYGETGDQLESTFNKQPVFRPYTFFG